MKGLIQEQMDNQQAPTEQGESPQYVQAVEFAYQMIYSEEGSNDIANALSKTGNKAESLSDMAYELTQVAAERAGLSEEDLVLLAMTVLAEMGEVGEAAGVSMGAPDIAQAFKLMVLRMFGELGFNTTELEQAMNAYTPEMINEAVAMVEGEAPEPEMGAV